MKRKYLIGTVIVLVLCLAVLWIARMLSAPSDLPPGVSTTTPSVTKVTPTPTVTKTVTPTPSTTTVTVTPTSPGPTAQTITRTTTPPPQPVGCVQDGVSTAGWDTEPKNSGSIYPKYAGPLQKPSISTGDCFDKIVFDVLTISGVEFTAQYVPVITADGSGAPVTDIKGSKFIQLGIKANMLNDGGVPIYDPADYNKPDVQGFGNLRELRLVTPNFEGYATFGIGVDTMMPFAVVQQTIDSTMTEVAVYIARPHR